MSKTLHQLYPALESESISPNQTRIDSDYNAFLDSHHALEAQTLQLDTALEDHAVLSQLSNAVEQRGLMSAQSAQVLQISVESIQHRLGLQTPIIPSLESYRSINTQGLATKIALEGLVDMVIEVGRAIVRFFKALWEKIASFFKKALQEEEKLKKEAEDLKTKLKAMDKDKKPKEETFTDESLVKHFAHQGTTEIKPGRISEIINRHDVWCKALKEFPSYFNLIGIAFHQVLNVKEFDIEERAKRMQAWQNNIVSARDHVEGKISPIKDKEFIDGKKYELESTDEDFNLKTTDHSVDNADIKVYTAKIPELITIMDDVIKLVDVVDNVGKNSDHVIKEAEKTVKDLEKELDFNRDMLEESKTEENKENVRVFKNLTAQMTKISKGLGGIYTLTVREGIKAGKAGVRYCEACVKQY